MAKRKMKPKAVVLDLDDTIVDFCGDLCWLHNKIHDTCVTAHDIKDWNFETLRVKDARGNEVTGEQLRTTFQEWEEHGLYASVNLIPKAKEALIIMRSFGYKIIFITARPLKFKQQTLLHIMRHNLPYDGLYFKEDPEEKHFKTKKIKQIAKEYNIQLFADDKLSTVKDIAENTKISNVCLVETASTRDLETEDYVIVDFEDLNVKKVRDLYETTRFLKEVK